MNLVEFIGEFKVTNKGKFFEEPVVIKLANKIPGVVFKEYQHSFVVNFDLEVARCVFFSKYCVLQMRFAITFQTIDVDSLIFINCIEQILFPIIFQINTVVLPESFNKKQFFID